MSLHKYLYANGSPINGIDPTGHAEFSITGLITSTAIGAGLGAITVGGIRGARAYATGASWAVAWQEFEDGAITGAEWGAAIGAGTYLGAWALSKVFFASGGNIATANILAKTFVGFHASAVGFILSMADYQEALKSGDEVEQRIALIGLVASGTGLAESRYGVYTINAPRTSVIGPFPSYVELSNNIDGNYFQIPPKAWDVMTPEQRWFENRVFLDDAIDRGDTFLISGPFRAGSYTEKEIEYLTSKGYARSSDGSQLNPPTRR